MGSRNHPPDDTLIARCPDALYKYRGLPILIMHKLTNVDEASRTATCSVCGPVDVYYRESKKYWLCKEARRQYDRDRQRKSGNLYFPDGTRRPSTQEIAAMNKAQSGLCAICQEPLTNPKVDHCHASKRVRGLLCHNCNVGLGHFGDSPERLARAINYLKRNMNV